MDNPNDDIEQQLLRLTRRTQAIHVRTSSGEVLLERSSYGILCLILAYVRSRKAEDDERKPHKKRKGKTKVKSPVASG